MNPPAKGLRIVIVGAQPFEGRIRQILENRDIQALASRLS
jgi:hypothetical protein